VRVRLVPVPENTRLPAGNRFVSELVTARARRLVGVGSSDTTNGTASAVSSGVETATKAETIGGSFTQLTVTVNSRVVA